MDNSKQLWSGFSIIILIVTGLGIYSQLQLSNMAEDIDDLYVHPFTVSNSAEKINYNLVSMHRYMKDVVLSIDENELMLAVSKVQFHEQEVLKDFDVIFERFLGDKSQLNQTYKAFLSWQIIRNEVIQLMLDNKKADAIAITKGKGAKHVANLNRLVQELNVFAHKKAKLFHSRAMDNKNQTLIISSTLTVLAITLVIVFAYYIMNNLHHAKLERLSRNHLIDQHIMLATLDKNAVVKDVSSALCRFLGVTKKDLIGKPSHFFDNSDDSEALENEIMAFIDTGAEWKGEIRHYDREGNLSWAKSTLVPNYNAFYKIDEITNVLVSITHKKLSSMDKLTSLLNRRRFDECLAHEMRLASHNGYYLTLAILDIDHFKNYNDYYGHPKGDNALQQTSQSILSFINRTNDYAFRIGGEEFAMLFSNLSVTESEQYLDAVRHSIELLHIDHQDSSISEYLTISIGAHVIPPESSLTDEQLYIEADKALYLAKNKRNTVIVTS